MQKIIFIALLALIGLFQFELWSGAGGIDDGQKLIEDIHKQKQINQQFQERNDLVADKIEELKGSRELIEARARFELNLIKPNEVLIKLSTDNTQLTKPK